MSQYISGTLPKPERKTEETATVNDYSEGTITFDDDDAHPRRQADPIAVATSPLAFSPEAQAVMNAGRELWRYYHQQPDANPNAALYDIRLYFQGTKPDGKMKTGSDDNHYTSLLNDLKSRFDDLARRIEPKIYEYGFLL